MWTEFNLQRLCKTGLEFGPLKNPPHKGIHRVLLTAARLTGRFPRFGHGTAWESGMSCMGPLLRFPQQITCWISAFFTCCFEGVAPVYLQKLCCSTLGVHRRDSLCFSRQGELLVLQLQTFIMQCPVFSVAGPAIEIERPVALWVMPRAHIRF